MLTPAAGFTKLLHVGGNRDLAPRLAAALGKAGQAVDVAWVGSGSDAMGWVTDNPDFGAVIVDDRLQHQSSAGVIRDVRGLGLTGPILVVATAGAAPPLAALKAGADDWVVNGQSLIPDLASLVVKGLHRAKGLAGRPPLRCLYLGDAALARKCFTGRPRAVEIVEPGRDSARRANPVPFDAPGRGQKLPFDVVLAEHGRPGVDIFAILKDVAARRLQLPVIFVVEWDEDLIVPALRMGAVDYVLKTRDAFEALSFRIGRVRSGSIAAREFADLLGQRTELRASLEDATTARASLEARLASAETTIRTAAEQQAALAATAVELREELAHVEAALGRTTDARDALARELKGATEALNQAQQRQASDAAILERLAGREAELAARLDEEVASRRALQEELTQGERRASDERDAAARERAQRKAEFDARLAEQSSARESLERQLREISTALEQTRRARMTDAAAAADRLFRREHDLSAAIAETAAVRDVLESRVAEVELALRRAEEEITDREAAGRSAAQREADLQARLDRDAASRAELEGRLRDAEAGLRAAAEESTRREAQLKETIAETAAARDASEHRLAEVEAALRQAEARATKEREAAAQAAALREAEVETRFAHDAALRESLERELSVTEETLRETIAQHASEMASASERLDAERTRYAAESARSAAARGALEQQLHDVSLALAEANEARHSEGVEAADRLARREAELSATIRQVTTILETTERRLAESEAALQQRTQQAADDRLAAVEDALRRQTEFDARLAEERTRRTECETMLAETVAARDTLAQRLNDATLALDETMRASASDAAAAAERLARREAELTATLTKSTALREGLEALVSERDAQLKEQALSHAAAQEALQAGAASRVAQLRHQLEEMAEAHCREFDRLPSCMLRCSRDGVIEQVNGAMTVLLGYRAPRDVQSVDFATAVLDSPVDWRLLIDRCIEAKTAQSIETTWKTKDGVRFAVRLHAVTSPSGQIDVVAEDLTTYRELEGKLRRSQRMEAVGRLASEVAATCDSLLRDVSQDGHAWLAAIGDDSPVRQRGELLLGDVTRAAGFLRQLDAYGKKQADSLEPVELNRVLRNLTPVLKRVAGDGIEFVLPKSSSPCTVDVELDRLERIFVTLAAYSRERMPLGGRLTFELGEVLVGGDGAAEHPDVRPGPHVLITVTAVRYAVWSDASRTLPRVSLGTAAEPTPDRLGVDLGAIQTLIRGCGGRLWLAAEPPGDMVLKIHLPRVALELAAVAQKVTARPMRRWLRVAR